MPEDLPQKQDTAQSVYRKKIDVYRRNPLQAGLLKGKKLTRHCYCAVFFNRKGK